ncbi:MAG: tyrosine-type recombinase/integrase [Bellilinea sp.]
MPDYVTDWANQFYLAKKSEGVSPTTLIFYKQQLGHFLRYCEWQALSNIHDLDAHILRKYILWHEETGHNAGGQHAAFRVLRTFLLWYEDEVELQDWRNPIHKVKAPKLTVEPLDPVEVNDVSSMLHKCNGNNYLDLRDKALLLFLLDTGARAGEVINANVADINLVSGEVLIRLGKGRKPRTVFLGKASRKGMRAYLKLRTDTSPALWVSDDRERMTYGGLRAIIFRRAKQASIDTPSLHSFRRAFAINMLRAGVDVFSLQRLMGHADLQVLRRYLAQTTEDIAQAHRLGSPVDNANL